MEALSTHALSGRSWLPLCLVRRCEARRCEWLVSECWSCCRARRSCLRQPHTLTRGGAARQVLLVLTALASVPIMLLPKPLILKKRHEKRAAQLEAYGRVSAADADDEEPAALHVAAPHGGHDEEEFDFSEVMVHQARRPAARRAGLGGAPQERGFVARLRRGPRPR